MKFVYNKRHLSPTEEIALVRQLKLNVYHDEVILGEGKTPREEVLENIIKREKLEDYFLIDMDRIKKDVLT